MMAFGVNQKNSGESKQVEMLAELVALSYLTERDSWTILDKKTIRSKTNPKIQKMIGKNSDIVTLKNIGAAVGASYSLVWTQSDGSLTFTLADLKAGRHIAFRTDKVSGSKEQMISIIYGLLKDLFSGFLKKDNANFQAESKKTPATVDGVIAPNAENTAQKPVNKVGQASAVLAKTSESADSKGPTQTGNNTVATEAEKSVPINPYKICKHVGLWTGIAIDAGGAVFAGLAYKYNREYKSGDVDKAELRNTYNNLSIGFFVAGSALIVTGIVLFFLDPGDAEWAKRHRLAITPTFGDRVTTFNLTGNW